MIRRWTVKNSAVLPERLNWLELALALVIPGMGFYVRGPRILGLAMIAACLALAGGFCVWLGYPLGNLAFGLIISIHASGIAYYCNNFLGKWEFALRIVFTLLVLMFLGFLFYAPLRSAIENYGVTAIRSHGHVIVLNSAAPAKGVRRGDHVAYRLSGYYFSNHWGNGVSDHVGLGFGVVLATGGDRVEFSAHGCSVNGVRQPAMAHMPVSGGLVVAQNHWFIWPNLAISGNWNVDEGNISAAMLQLSDVSEKQYVAKAFQQWFWRKQILQ